MVFDMDITDKKNDSFRIHRKKPQVSKKNKNLIPKKVDLNASHLCKNRNASNSMIIAHIFIIYKN